MKNYIVTILRRVERDEEAEIDVKARTPREALQKVQRALTRFQKTPWRRNGVRPMIYNKDFLEYSKGPQEENYEELDLDSVEER